MYQFSQASILVVDTDAESLFSIVSILNAQKHRVLTANDAAAACDLARKETLDLLITDIWLKDQSGMELVKSIRQGSDKTDLPVMFISAHQSPGVIRRSHDLGAAYHLKKPVNPQVLCELTSKALWLPHLVRSHIEQKTVKQPHIAFANNPLANPFEACSNFPGTPIAF